MSNEALLQVQDLRIGLGNGQLLLRDIGFSVHRGQTFALLGESGSGKTLSALSIVRLLPPAIRFYGGTIRFCGNELLRLPEARMEMLRGREIAFVFQEPATALNPVLDGGTADPRSLAPEKEPGKPCRTPGNRTSACRSRN